MWCVCGCVCVRVSCCVCYILYAHIHACMCVCLFSRMRACICVFVCHYGVCVWACVFQKFSRSRQVQRGRLRLAKQLAGLVSLRWCLCICLSVCLLDIRYRHGASVRRASSYTIILSLYTHTQGADIHACDGRGQNACLLAVKLDLYVFIIHK